MPNVKLPANATAKIGQTSLLGSQHVELAAPPNPSPEPLKSGDTIPLKNSSAFPTTERTLASIATVLRGGGIPNLEVIQTEVNNILDGRADQIRDFLGQAGHVHRLSSTSSVTTSPGRSIRPTGCCRSWRSATTRSTGCSPNVPPLIKHFADTRDLFADAVDGAGPVQRGRRPDVCRVEGQPAHQPAAAAAAAEAAGSGVAVSARLAEADC